MSETEVALAGGAAADTEIDLYADVVENELETGDDYAAQSDPLGNDPDLYDDVITTQSSATDFTDITNTVNQSHAKLDHIHESNLGGSGMSIGYNGKRVSLYVGQMTWVRIVHNYDSIDRFSSFV
jgi:hypothetical protein